VPNFLSPDDVFVTEGARQSSVRKAKLAEWLTQEPTEFCDEQQLKNYRRNEKMVDLNQIPLEIQAAILEEYAKPIVGDRSLIYGYFIRFRLANLMELIRDF
jgi:T4 RNase H, C terminal